MSTRTRPTDSNSQTPANSGRRATRPKPAFGYSTATAEPDLTDFEIDEELLSHAYNQLRKPRLPNAVVVNAETPGIVIPTDQLEQSGWLASYETEGLTTIELGGKDVEGLFLTEVRMLILGSIPVYIRYKDADQLTTRKGDPALALTVVGDYETCKPLLQKEFMDVVSEHVIVFLDETNQPLHTVPFYVRFKNVSLWSLKATYDDYYRMAESAFAKATKQPFSGKNDRWRSLIVLCLQFIGEKQGQGKNRSWCCKSQTTETPTPETLANWFLGTPASKNMVWSFQDDILGFVPSDQATLPAGDPIAKLPASTRGNRQATFASSTDLSVDDDDGDFIDTTATELDEGFDEDEDEFDDE